MSLTMQDFALLATICGIHTLALMARPDFLMAVKNSLTYSRRTGIYTALGFALGIATHLLYCVTGLAFIISKSILLFNVIKYFGAAYLIYIGIKSIVSKTSPIRVSSDAKKPDISPFQAVKTGYLTNVLNPKATLYMLALFTLVIKPETPTSVLIGASAYMILSTAAWFSLVAVFFSHRRIRSVYEKFEKIIISTFGGLLVLVGVRLALVKE